MISYRSQAPVSNQIVNHIVAVVNSRVKIPEIVDIFL